jgi:hypothetical protein
MNRNIKEIQAELSALRNEYEAKVRELQAEIVSVRKARGTKLKEPNYSGYIEMGRSAATPVKDEFRI